MARPSPAALDLAGTAVRVCLAAVWLGSGALKAADPNQTYLAVQAYDVLPAGMGAGVAAGLPWVEIGLGLLLLVGFGTRWVAGLSAVLLVVFVAGVTQAWARGLAIDCGCFGGGGQVSPDQTHYLAELLRDTGFLLLAGWLIVRPRTRFALDGRLAGLEAGEPVDATGAAGRVDGASA